MAILDSVETLISGRVTVTFLISPKSSIDVTSSILEVQEVNVKRSRFAPVENDFLFLWHSIYPISCPGIVVPSPPGDTANPFSTSTSITSTSGA